MYSENSQHFAFNFVVCICRYSNDFKAVKLWGVVICFQFRSFVFVDTAHLQETAVYQKDKHNK